MYEMSDTERAERARVKALHQAIRGMGCSDRYVNLAWGFVRGFKYRRIERSHHLQPYDASFYGAKIPPHVLVTPEGAFYQHNFPSSFHLHRVLSKHVDVTPEQVDAWLADPEGAIPAPPPRPRRQWKPEEASP